MNSTDAIEALKAGQAVDDVAKASGISPNVLAAVRDSIWALSEIRARIAADKPTAAQAAFAVTMGQVASAATGVRVDEE